MLDKDGNVIELKEDDEDTYPPDRVREDDDYYQYRDENEFADSGFTFKENSDDDDLAADEEDDYSDDFGGDPMDEE